MPWRLRQLPGSMQNILHACEREAEDGAIHRAQPSAWSGQDAVIGESAMLSGEQAPVADKCREGSLLAPKPLRFPFALSPSKMLSDNLAPGRSVSETL